MMGIFQLRHDRVFFLLNTLLSYGRPIICQVVAYGRFKTKENFWSRSLTERWSLTRGSKYSDLTAKRLVFWKTGPRGEVVALREMIATGGSTVYLKS